MLPKLKEENFYRLSLSSFGTYHPHEPCAFNETLHETNLSHEAYPLLKPRAARGLFAAGTAPGALIVKDTLCWTDSGSFYINGYRVAMDLTAGEKELASMGPYVIILPDKKWINTTRVNGQYQYGNIDAVSQTSTATIMTLATKEGVSILNYTRGETPPDDPVNGTRWLDLSVTPHCMRRFNSKRGAWEDEQTYIRMTSPNIGSPFSEGDGVVVSGCDDEAMNGPKVLRAAGQNFILIDGVIDETSVTSETVTVSRRMPDLDVITECGNRLWGCKYGFANGKADNTIYACAAGDFLNWNLFEGKNTDSVALSVGTDGGWTGAACQLGYPVFFKETHLHKVYGTTPSSFSVQDIPGAGIEQGAAHSVVSIGGKLYYKCVGGVAAFDGSHPVRIPSPADGESGIGASGGAIGDLYYLCRKISQTEAEVLVYDTSRKIWRREDSTLIRAFASDGRTLYMISGDSILTQKGGSLPVSWSFETGGLGTQKTDKKLPVSLLIRADIPTGSTVTAKIRYDGGDPVLLGILTSSATKRAVLPIRPRDCDTFSVILEGSGDILVKSLDAICLREEVDV